MRTKIRTLTALGLVTALLLGGAWGWRGGANLASAQADPGEILTQGIDAFNRGDVEAVMQLYSDDAVFTGIVPCSPVECRGKGAIRSAVEFYVADNIGITITSSEVSGDVVLGSAEIESDMVRATGVERFVSSYRVEVSGDTISHQRFDFDLGDAQTSAFLTQVAEKTVTVQLAPGRETDQIPGWAQLLGFGDRTAVAVALVTSRPEDAGQPVNIHEGSCADLGAVVFPLRDAGGGISATLLDVPLSELRTGGLAVNVQQSREDPDTYVACGDIPAAAGEEGRMRTPEGPDSGPAAGSGGALGQEGGGPASWWYALVAGGVLLVIVGLAGLTRSRARGTAGE